MSGGGAYRKEELALIVNDLPAILKEMLQQEVADMQTAQENLRNWIRQDEDRVKEIDARLQKLAVEGGK